MCSCVFSRILVCKTKHHATDAQDLLFVQLQIEAEQTFHGGDAVGFQHNFITVAIIVHAVVVAFDLTADHLLFDIVGMRHDTLSAF